MPKHRELFESRPDRNDQGMFYKDRSRERRTADRWGAGIAGGILFALPTAGGLYRGVFDWVDIVVALMGIGGLAVAAERFARKSKLNRGR